MEIEEAKIRELLMSTTGLQNFLVFLAGQEIDRLAEALQMAMSAASPGTADYKAWSASAKSSIAKEFLEIQEFLGFKDIASRFPVEDFLQAYYKTMAQ